MNYRKTFLFFFLAGMFFLTGFRKNKEGKMLPEDEWSGMVTFHEKKTGSTIARHDWWMIATIKNNRGIAIDSAIIETTEGDKWRCATGDTTELELGIEEAEGIYGITVRIPGCYGYGINKYGERQNGYGLTDETAIVINKQRLGSNRDSLFGNLVQTEHAADGTQTVTTYTWNLKKSK